MANANDTNHFQFQGVSCRPNMGKERRIIMNNGRPETYREIIVLKKALTIVEYLQVYGVNLVERVCNFLLEAPGNRVIATPANIQFMKGSETVEMYHVTSVLKEFTTMEASADRFLLTSPHSRIDDSSSGGGSSNNDNNNNNNNNNS